MPDVLPTLLAGSLCILAVGPVLAAEVQSDDKWQAQDSWERFCAKEAASGLKLSKPKPAPQADLLPDPVLPGNSAAAEEGRSYVLMPAAAQAPPLPQVQLETTYAPGVQRQTPYVPAYFGNVGYFGVPGIGFAPSWGSGPWGRAGWGGAGWGGAAGRGFGVGSAGRVWGGSLGAGAAPGTVIYRPLTQVIQTGPSKPSGNYYSPGTADPTASGNYYASPEGGLLKLAPIIHQPPPTKDYWGANGNPLPDSLRPLQ